MLVDCLVINFLELYLLILMVHCFFLLVILLVFLKTALLYQLRIFMTYLFQLI